MKIVKAQNAHIPGILELLLQVGEVHHQIRPDIFRAGAQKYDAAALQALLRDENRPIFVAEAEGGLLGYCFCILRDYRGSGVQTDRTEVYIDDLCVDEGCRGQGVATALYRYVTGWAKENGCAFITLNVWQGNETAMAFYEHAGLTPRSITMEMALEENKC